MSRSPFVTQIRIGNAVIAERPDRRKAHRQDWKFSQALLRIREIEKVIRHRHGSMIPDPAGTDDVDLCLAYARAVAFTPGSQDIAAWCRKWAPWIDPVTVKTIAGRGFNRRRMASADAVARLLSVTMAERNRIGLKTIGACDIDRQARKGIAKASKRERDRRRQAERRRAEGQQDRQSYEATSLSKLKPWESEGISRRTWERRRVASPSPVDIIKGNGDTLASKPETSTTDTTPADRDRAAGSLWGPGDHPPAGFQGAAPHGIGDTIQGKAA